MYRCVHKLCYFSQKQIRKGGLSLNRKRKKANATEVAQLAGVSQSTVSRVFTPNDNKTVSDSLREKVLAAAEKLDYRPNALARGLIMNETKIIGLVMGYTENSFFANVLEKLTLNLRSRGYDVLFVHTQEGFLKEEEILRLLEYNIAGVIFTDAWMSSNAVGQLIEKDIPVVLFYRNIENYKCHYIGCDNFTSGYMTAKYLHELGHEKFAYFEGHEDSSTNRDRKNGFCTFLSEKNIAPIIEKSSYAYEAGYETGKKLLSKTKEVDAIFCADDIMALGTMDAARELGLHIPKDLSVIGFDDIPMASWSPYDLTTWRVPVDQMIDMTIETLLKEIAGESEEVVHIEYPCDFMERRTVKVVKE